jgi:hypothetical protein
MPWAENTAFGNEKCARCNDITIYFNNNVTS